MKKVVFLLALALALTRNCRAQTWSYAQDSLATYCSAGSSSCTINAGNMLPTTAGTVWGIAIFTANNVTISSASGGGAKWSLCPSSSCHSFNSTLAENLDIIYGLGGAAGTASVTVNLSSASSGFFGANFFEILPPAGSTPSFDSGGNTNNATCTPTCTGAALTITSTDAILQYAYAVANNTWNAWSAPYINDTQSTGLYLNATTGSAPTFQVKRTGTVLSAIAFKSTAGSFTPPSPPMSFANYSFADPNNGIVCNPSCSLTIPSTGSGHLLYLEASDLNSSFISSVSGGGTWVVPTGANTCSISFSGQSLSCAYALSSTPGTTSLNIKMTGSGATFFAVSEIATTTGSFTLDAQGSAQRSASFNPAGVSFCASGCTAPALTGANDVIFQAAFVPGGTSAVSLYPLPSQPMFFTAQASQAARLNTTDGTAPLWANQQNNATAVTGVAFMTTGTAPAPPAPPTGLAAVVN